jgi:hypothetical protein
MASRYWVGGSANWDATAGTKWATTSGGAGGASVPTSADDVFINAASGAVTVTIASGYNADAASITCTGFTGTLTASNTNLRVVGNITFSTSMSLGSGLTVEITGTSTLTNGGANGASSNSYQINSSGTVTLGNALTTSSAGLTVNSGTFSTANYSVTVNYFYVFGGAASLGSSTVTTNAWYVATGATLNAGTSTINYGTVYSATFGGKTYYNFAFTSTASINETIDGANTFNTLTLSAPSSGIRGYFFDSNQTISTLVATGASAVRRIGLYSSASAISPRTLSITTWSSISDVDFRGITLSSSVSGTRLGNGGGNTNITFDAPKTVYWNLAGAQNWSATAWATSSGGSPSVNNFPLAQDTAVFDNTGSVGTVSINANWNAGTVNMGGRSTAMTIDQSTSYLNVSGSWTNGSGTAFSGTQLLSFCGAGSQLLTSSGKTFPFSIYSSAVSLTLQDALVTSSATTYALYISTGGTFNANNFNVTCSGGGAMYVAPTTASMGSGTWTTAGFWYGFSSTTYTGTATISMTSASAKTFAGGGANYSGITLNQAGAGAISITGANTFGNISNSYSATGAATITLSGNQIVEDFTATGTVGKVLTLNSSSAGTQRTLTKSGGGTISVNYMSIQDSAAAGSGAKWYAGANSTNVSNNTGWIFTAPTSNGGNFFLVW